MLFDLNFIKVFPTMSCSQPNKGGNMSSIDVGKFEILWFKTEIILNLCEPSSFIKVFFPFSLKLGFIF